VAVLTGVILVVGLFTILTDKDMTAESFGTAVFDVVHGLEVRRGHTITELSPVLRTIEAEYVSKFRHEGLLRDLA
jgi:hypothetical protein